MKPDETTDNFLPLSVEKNCVTVKISVLPSVVKMCSSFATIVVPSRVHFVVQLLLKLTIGGGGPQVRVIVCPRKNGWMLKGEPFKKWTQRCQLSSNHLYTAIKYSWHDKLNHNKLHVSKYLTLTYCHKWCGIVLTLLKIHQIQRLQQLLVENLLLQECIQRWCFHSCNTDINPKNDAWESAALPKSFKYCVVFTTWKVIHFEI